MPHIVFLLCFIPAPYTEDKAFRQDAFFLTLEEKCLLRHEGLLTATAHVFRDFVIDALSRLPL